MTMCAQYNIMWQKFVTCNISVVFSGYTGSSSNETDRHDITEMLLKVALSTMHPHRPIPEMTCGTVEFSLAASE